MASTDQTSAPARDDTDPVEVARLREEVVRLRASLAEQQGSPGTRGGSAGPGAGGRTGRWRPVVAGLLVALAALLAPLSVLATWAGGQLEDTDRYLATVAPLAEDPDVQAAVAARIEQVVLSYLDLDAATDQLVTALETPGLPPEAADTLRGLSGPLSAAVRSFVSGRIEALVRSEVFRDAWVAANRTAHTQVVAALTGETDGAVQVDRGRVTLELGVLVGSVRSQLTDAGFGIADRIPAVDASYVLVQSDELSRVQRLLGLVDDLALWLPVVGLGLVAAAVVVARDRARALLAAGLAVAASMLLLGATLNVVRPLYLDALPASSSTAAAAAVYDQLVGFLRVALRGLLVVALTVAVVAWLSARTGPGAAARRRLAQGLAAARRRRDGAGLRTGRLGTAIAQWHGPLRVAVAGVAAVGYLSLDHPTATSALTVVLTTGVLLLALELLAGGTPATPAADPRTTP